MLQGESSDFQDTQDRGEPPDTRIDLGAKPRDEYAWGLEFSVYLLDYCMDGFGPFLPSQGKPQVTGRDSLPASPPAGSPSPPLRAGEEVIPHWTVPHPSLSPDPRCLCHANSEQVPGSLFEEVKRSVVPGTSSGDRSFVPGPRSGR